MSGPDNGTTTKLFASIMQSVNVQHRTILITLSSGQGSNLKTVLKNMNQHARNQTLENDEETVIDGAEVWHSFRYLNDGHSNGCLGQSPSELRSTDSPRPC